MILPAIFFGLLTMLHVPAPTRTGTPAPLEIEALRALPYVQWAGRADTHLKGVQKYDRNLSFPGINLYTDYENNVHLIDMTGKRLHTWKLPAKNCEHAEMLENGDLIAISVNQAIIRMDWNSKVIWQTAARVHHDFAISPDGSIFVLSVEARRYRSHDVEFDCILHLSRTGRILSRWSLFDNLETLKRYQPASLLDKEEDLPAYRYDYYHLNTLEVLPANDLGKTDKRFQAGNLLICSRNLDWIAILDRMDNHVVWFWGPGKVEGPHMPTMLENGNLLIFDNGVRRKSSRILELKPDTGEIVWQYQGNPPGSFFSAWRGSVQQLPNSNILICESEKGRVFEITRAGNIVWEFWNPEIANGKRKRIYRMMRLPQEKVIGLPLRS